MFENWFYNLTYYLFSISIFINEKLIYFYFKYCFHYNFRVRTKFTLTCKFLAWKAERRVNVDTKRSWMLAGKSSNTFPLWRLVLLTEYKARVLHGSIVMAKLKTRSRTAYISNRSVSSLLRLTLAFNLHMLFKDLHKIFKLKLHLLLLDFDYWANLYSLRLCINLKISI